MTKREKNVTKFEHCGAKFSCGHDLVLVRNYQKTISGQGGASYW